jgi:LytS/YehU family sensor histidine kinase
MQLRPHFLFNALHTVAALVRAGESRTAVRTLSELGEFLRWVLEQDDAQLVPLRRELDLLDRYLRIEQIRFQDRLTTQVDVEPRALEALVPTLILQPLVENAVRHGLADRPEGGRIVLGARVVDGQLVLTVDDDGAGAPAGEGTGIGVSTVRERLRVIYGEAATVEAGPRSPGFGVTLRLPVRRGEEELAA